MDESWLPWSNWSLFSRMKCPLFCADRSDSWSSIDLSARKVREPFAEAKPFPPYWNSGWREAVLLLQEKPNKHKYGVTVMGHNAAK